MSFARPGLALTLLPALACSPSSPGPDAQARIQQELAVTYQVTRSDQLIGGNRAAGQVGDWILENGVVRVLVQDVRRGALFNIYGGNLLDADVVRPSGQSGRDTLGEIFTAINLHTLIAGEEMAVVLSGVPDSPARLRLSGHTRALPALPPKEAVEAYPLAVVQEYLLEPGAHHVEVRTTVTNEGERTLGFNGGDVLLCGSSLTLSGQGLGWGEVMGRVDYLTAQGDGASYAWMDPSGPLMVPFEDAGQTGAITSWHRFGPGESITFRRYLVVGDRDAASATDALFALRNLPTGRVTGVARDSRGAAISGVELTFNDDQGYVTRALSRSDGTFDLRLPGGSYTATVTHPGRADGQGLEFTLSTGSTFDLAPVIGGAGTLSVTCRDEAQALTPCKVSADDGSGRRRLFTETGRLSASLKPGTWSLLISQGMERELVSTTATVSDGATTSVNAALPRRIDTTGFISVDSHLHSKNSNDSGLPLTDKVRILVSEGVEVAVATDHDWVTDYGPAASELGVDDLLHTIIGNESSVIDYGHFNFYPIVIDPSDPGAGNGSQYWYNDDFNPMGAAELFAKMRTGPGEEVIQVNHPRSGAKGYLDMIGYNTRTGRALREPLAEDFDAIEVQNEVFGDDAILLDFFSLVNQGLSPAAVGTSDSHDASDPHGMPRTFVAVPIDDPAFVSDADIIAGVKGQRVVVSTGVFPRISASGEGTGEVQGPGSLLVAPDGVVTLSLELEAPAWAPFDRFVIYENGQPLALAGGPGTYVADPEGSWPTLVTPTQANGRLSIQFEVEVNPRQDAYYLLVAWGEGRQALSGDTPLGYTNPLYVDRDGDGWEPPGAGTPVGPAPRWPEAALRHRTCDHHR